MSCALKCEGSSCRMSAYCTPFPSLPFSFPSPLLSSESSLSLSLSLFQVLANVSPNCSDSALDGQSLMRSCVLASGIVYYLFLLSNSLLTVDLLSVHLSLHKFMCPFFFIFFFFTFQTPS